MSADVRPLCLLTGASGYLGGLIARRLAAQGWEVVGLTRKPRPGERAFALGGGVEAETLAGADALVHCAYDFAPVNWSDIEAINVEGSARLFAAARAAGVANLVFISTISAFDGCKSKYGRAKLLIEERARAAGACIIRPGLVYGASPGAMFGRLVAQVRATAIAPMPGGGRQLMFTVHEDDLSEAIARALSRPQASRAAVTVAHERPTAFVDIVRAIGARLGRKVAPLPFPWRLMWIGLRSAEILHIPIGFRSDSLVSLVNQDRTPLLNAERELGVRCRPFELESVAL